MKELKPHVRTFLLGAITLSITVWNLSFDFGVYNAIFYHKIFLIWISSIAVFIACLILPKSVVPIPAWGLLILLFPSFWIALGWVDIVTDNILIDIIILVVIALILAVCLPYMLYVIVTITNPEIVGIKSKRLRYGLFMIALIVGLLGFGIGRNHNLFLTCDEFEVSGDKVPENCHNPNGDTVDDTKE